MTKDHGIFDCVLSCRFLSYPDDVYEDNVLQAYIRLNKNVLLLFSVSPMINDYFIIISSLPRQRSELLLLGVGWFLPRPIRRFHEAKLPQGLQIMLTAMTFAIVPIRK